MVLQVDQVVSYLGGLVSLVLVPVPALEVLEQPFLKVLKLRLRSVLDRQVEINFFALLLHVKQESVPFV
jgi:hypothetical protein